MYNCEILAHSSNTFGDELITFKLTYPRIIHAEIMTHRMFSRNSASSRAIPFKKMVQMVNENPFVPIAWQKDHKGMQGNEYIKEGEDYNEIVDNWLQARDRAVKQANELNDIGVTKQLCNRLLEPFMWHTVIITTGLKGLYNFFSLRCPRYDLPFDTTDKTYLSWLEVCKEHNNIVGIEDFSILDKLQYNTSQADIHIQPIAEMMLDCYNESEPTLLKAGEWHIPFGDKIDEDRIAMLYWSHNHISSIEETKLNIVTARCARISYNNFKGRDDYKADIKLYDRLKASKHWSPFEHVAKCMSNKEYYELYNSTDGWCRNFKGFIQLRALVDNN